MRTRLHTMTFLLVLTLLTNLFRHERGIVTASGEVHTSEFPSRRRMLERLLRLGLTSSDNHSFPPPNRRTTEQHLFPARSALDASEKGRTHRPPLGNSLVQWFHSNHIPNTKISQDQRDEALLSLRHPLTPPNSSSPLDEEEVSNLFFPMSNDVGERTLPLLLRQYKLSHSMDDSTLRRRHATRDEAAAAAPAEGPPILPLPTTPRSSAKELRNQRKLEKKKRREEKKKKRNSEKRKRRKQNKRFKEILKNEDVVLHNIDGEEFLDCCPSKLVVVEKQVGKDRNNHAVEVRPSHQYFYERVCLQDIEDKECVFPARSLKKGVVTRCAQQFSYVQAQVRPYRSDSEWHLDYIYVRSGCSCQVSVTSSKRRKRKG